MATGKRLECKLLSSLFFVARRNEIHRIRALKPILQSLVLTILCLCAGCYSAGGKPVGLLAALRGSVEKPLSAKEISEQMQSSEKARGQLTKSGTVFQFERDIVIEDFDGKGNLKRR